jgi:hypothetical protein
MTDRFNKQYSSLHGPYKDAFVITPDDGTVFSQPTAALTVSVAGNVNVEMMGYDSRTVFGPAANIDFVDGGGSDDQITINSANTTYNFVTEGYGVGDALESRDVDGANTYTILSISGANNETVNVATASVTANATNTTARLCRSFGANVLFQAVQAGIQHKVRAVKIYSTSTAATGIMGWY